MSNNHARLATAATEVERTDRPLRRDAEANRRRLLDAASEAFAAHGLDASVEEIAHSAGVGMGTLYRRFPTKEVLIQQLVHNLLDDVLAAGRRALTAPGETGLALFLREAATLQHAQRGCLSRTWNVPLPADFRPEFYRILTELLLRAQTAGTIRTDCTVNDLTVVFWAVRGIIESTGDGPSGAWLRHLDIVLAGLHPNATAPSRRHVLHTLGSDGPDVSPLTC
jgi:AcrR family transcriptional regulator